MAHDLGITVWPIRLLFAFWLLVAPVLITVVTGIIAGYLIPHTRVLWGIVLGFPLGIVNIFWSYWFTGLWPKFYYSKFYQDRMPLEGIQEVLLWWCAATAAAIAVTGLLMFALGWLHARITPAIVRSPTT